MNRRDKAVHDILYSALEEAAAMKEKGANQIALFAMHAALRAYDAGYNNACQVLRGRRRKKRRPGA